MNRRRSVLTGRRSRYAAFCLWCAAVCAAAGLLTACGSEDHTDRVTAGVRQPAQADPAFEQMIRQVQAGAPDTSAGQVKYYSGTGESLQQTMDSLQPGDTLYLRGGTYKTGNEELYADLSGLHGQEGRYITIASEPGEQAVFDGGASGENAEDAAKRRIVFELGDASYLRLSGLTVRNVQAAENAEAISVSADAHHIIIDRCEISGIRVLQPSKRDHCANAIICYHTTVDPAAHFYIYRNQIHDLATGWSEAVSFNGNCQDIRIVGNEIRDTGNIGIDVAGNYGVCSDPALDQVCGGLIAENTVSGCVSAYGDTAYGIYADGAQRIEIRNNTVSGCSGGIEIGAEQPADEACSTQKIQVTDNLLQDNMENGITVGGWRADASTGWVYDCEISGNTIRQKKDSGAVPVTINKCEGIRVTGNTIQAAGTPDEVIVQSFGKKEIRDLQVRNNTVIQP